MIDHLMIGLGPAEEADVRDPEDHLIESFIAALHAKDLAAARDSMKAAMHACYARLDADDEDDAGSDY